MSSDPLAEPQLEILDERPRQFGLIHMMGLMTVLALAFALLAPLFRAMSGRQALYVLTIVLIQIAIVVGSYLWASAKRENLLSIAGRRVGQSNFGMAKSRAFGRFATACGFLFFAILQLALVILLLSWTPDGSFPWYLFISQFQMGLFASHALMQLRSGRDFGAIEFFEHGMADATQQFTPWERIVVRPSKLYEHGVNLHIKPTSQYGGATMTTVFVSDPLRQYLLQHHGEEPAAASTDKEAS